MKYICYYNVYIPTVIVKSFMPTKILVAHHFDKVRMFTWQIYIHDWVYLDYMVTENMEICDLNSYTHACI